MIVFGSYASSVLFTGKWIRDFYSSGPLQFRVSFLDHWDLSGISVDQEVCAIFRVVLLH